MDTRLKILDSAQVRQLVKSRPEITVVAGHFDVLVATHAEQLESHKRPGRPLLVWVRDLPGALLPRSARAELAASLKVVDYVYAGDEAGILPSFTSLEQEHEATRSRLIEHVRSRH